MKRFKLFLTAVILLPLVSSAQMSDSFSSYFTVGPKAGVNFSSFDGVDGAESKTGFAAGAFFIYSFQEHFGVSADLMYSMEGGEFTSSSTEAGVISTTVSKTKLSYLRIPVLANVFFGQHGNTIRPKVVLGPSIGFLLAAESENETTMTSAGTVSTSTSTVDVKDNFSGTDFGAVAGAGLNIKIAEMTWLNFDVNYYIGASDIIDAPGSEDAVKNRNLGINVGVGFGI